MGKNAIILLILLKQAVQMLLLAKSFVIQEHFLPMTLVKHNLQVGLSLNFNPEHKQWANVTALHRTHCLWKPTKCTTGATLALWIKTQLFDQTFEGILTTMDDEWQSERWLIGWTDIAHLG